MPPDAGKNDARISSTRVEEQLAAEVKRLFGPSRLRDRAIQEQLKVTADGISRLLATKLDPDETPPMTNAT